MADGTALCGSRVATHLLVAHGLICQIAVRTSRRLPVRRYSLPRPPWQWATRGADSLWSGSLIQFLKLGGSRQRLRELRVFNARFDPIDDLYRRSVGLR